MRKYVYRSIIFQFRYTEFGLETLDGLVGASGSGDFQFRYTEFGLETHKPLNFLRRN